MNWMEQSPSRRKGSSPKASSNCTQTENRNCKTLGIKAFSVTRAMQKFTNKKEEQVSFLIFCLKLELIRVMCVKIHIRFSFTCPFKTYLFVCLFALLQIEEKTVLNQKTKMQESNRGFIYSAEPTGTLKKQFKNERKTALASIQVRMRFSRFQDFVQQN